MLKNKPHPRPLSKREGRKWTYVFDAANLEMISGCCLHKLLEIKTPQFGVGAYLQILFFIAITSTQ